jgi:transposase-like protein
MSQELVVLLPDLCPSGCRTGVVRSGHYFRKSDRVRVQRYLCAKCKMKFSDATWSACFGQKKRQWNFTIFKLLTGGYSQRRIALDLNLNPKTVARKFLFLGLKAMEVLPKLNHFHSPVKEMEFDDLETFEHTRLKPLSVILAVEYATRRILGFRVASAPAKGRIAALSRRKYGPRKDQRKLERRKLFEELKAFVAEDALIKSDQNPHYQPDVADFFPGRQYQTFKGKRASVVGQGELKGKGFDPIFSVNHTLAMLRANINRLFRRTWCTTKKQERLALHIALYAIHHNLVLI